MTMRAITGHQALRVTLRRSVRLGERLIDAGAGSQMSMRLGRCATGLLIACAISLLVLPLGAAGAAQETKQAPEGVETAQGHAEEDAVELTPAQELQMSRASRKRSVAASARARADTAGDPGEVGSWGPVEEWPVVPIWAALLPDGKVLAYASVGDKATESFAEQNKTEATLWDPTTGKQTNVTLEDGFNIFCSGFALMEEGNLFVAGGNKNQLLEGIVQTVTFDWENNSWIQGPNMSYPRWYPTVTEMGNGEMLITSGGPPIPEVRQNDGSLRQLTHASLPLPLYPWMSVAPNGKAFESGPDPTLRELNPSGTGSWQLFGERDPINRTYGSHAEYEPGKILVAGGGPSTKSADVIDLGGATPTVTPTQEMAYGRRQNNLTILADGTVLSTGGNSSGAELVDMNAGVYPAELWNPATGEWKTLSSMAVTRQYHSTALLLPDGRVLSGGGGICGICDEVGYLNKNAEIFSPPYLFKHDGSGELAPRPTVTSVPKFITENTQFTVDTPDAASIKKVALVKLGAVTHSNNMGQQYVPVQFTTGAGGLTVTAPADTSTAPPGYYMLFIINSAGVPSVAPIVHLAAPEATPTEVPDPSAGGWTLNGSAALSGHELVLTEATNFQHGDAIWPKTTETRNMSVEFDASIGGGTGADGLTMFFADPSRGATPGSLGGEGGALGFLGIPGDAIALDEFQGAGAPSNDFVGITDGPASPSEPNVPHWLATANLTAPIQNATTHVKVLNSAGITTVYINGEQVLSVPLALPPTAYIGFSAGTGAVNNRHAVSNVVVTGATPPPSTLTAAVTLQAEPEQSSKKFVVSGTCPSSFGTAPLGDKEAVEATLTGAFTGTSCSVFESAPSALGWTATASVNGGAPIALTETEGKFEVPSFALVAGVNTVQFTNVYTRPPEATLSVGVGVHAPSGSEQLGQTFTVAGSCPSAFTGGPLGAGGSVSPSLTNAIEGAECAVTESAPAGSGWTATASVNGGVPVSLTAAGGEWTVPSFALAAGANTIQLTNTYTPPTSVPDPTAGGWQLNGSSAMSHTGLVLTSATQFQSGSAFWPKAIDPQNMTVEYEATVGGGTGADGLAMVIADPSRGATPTSLGTEGGGLGFSGIPGAAIALDEFQDPGAPSNNFLGLTEGPASASSPNVLEWLATANLAAPIQGATNKVRVVTANGQIAISVNGLELIDQPLTLPSSAYLGFSAGTGGLDNRHEISNLLVNLEPPKPVVSSISPTAGAASGATSVAITGTGLAGATAVKFGTANAAGFKVDSPTSITATSPEGSGTVDVTVITPDGTSATGSGDRFQFVPAGPAPAITKAAPKSGPAAGGTTVTLTGTGFVGVTEVEFGATPAASFAVTGPTSLSAVAPPGTVGSADIRIVTPNGTSPVTTKAVYKYGSPTVTGVAPGSGARKGGASVTVTGSGFATGTSTLIWFAKALATSAECSSTTSCTAVVPPAAKPGAIDVVAQVAGKKSKKSAADRFTYE
jgi:hypothetical protein